MPDHYLVRCLRQFEEVSRTKYGKPFHLKAIEEKIRFLRQPKRKLRVSDLACFRDKDNWWFERYWVLPSSADVDPHLADQTFDFWELSKNTEGTPKERAIIEDLLTAFRSIELVSIILRFLCPESFGILSPPVERFLATERGRDAVATYLNYLRNIREIRDRHKGLPRAADVDMAVWVLHEKCFTIPVDDPAIKHEYEQDGFLRQLRTANLVAPLRGLSLPRLAEALENVRNDLAGLVGCYAFEEGLRKRAELEGLCLTRRDEGGCVKPLELVEIINKLHGRKIINAIDARRWHGLREIRNKVFHAEIDAPSEDEIQALVQEVIEIDVSNRDIERTRQSKKT
ncbi:MAG: hypothetical protein GDA67_14580 [Nitrospira sp. CR1.3]|nr:hypothetical protein [Nitrospira sp. CR1.3]